MKLICLAGGTFHYHKPRVPHISPGFGEMWDLTALGLEILKRDQHSCASIRQFPHLAKTRRDMGHPRFVVMKRPGVV